MRLVNGARILVGVWVILSCGVFVLMLNGFKPYQALILLLWVAAPLPLAAGGNAEGLGRHRCRSCPRVRIWRLALLGCVPGP